MMNQPNIAIIGAGISAAILANELSNMANIRIFEKSRGVSGRLATRYSGDYMFDHGAPFFTARTKAFQQFLTPWIDQGTLAEWQARTITFNKLQKPYQRIWFEPHYVARNKMNSWCKLLLSNHEVQLGTEISNITHADKKWRLQDTSGNTFTDFDLVISTAPSDQTQLWFPRCFKHLDSINNIKMTPSFSLMLGIQNLQRPNWDIAKIVDSPIEWVAIDSSKPGHNSNALSITVHSTQDWAFTHLESPAETVTEQLITAINDVINLSAAKIDYQTLHRWKFASNNISKQDVENKLKPQPPAYYWDKTHQLAAAGDWCLYGDVESAFISASELAKEISAHIETQ